ncbi:MAG TPA: AMP-binding protein [Syntrophales bacterium]|nr:AMP-binding protein [Syntrophales bacterium]
MEYANLGKMLEHSAKRYSASTSLIFKDLRISYNDLNEAVDALANHLWSISVNKGDKVALLLPNCPEFVISYFAVVKLGAVAVTLSIFSTPYELKHLLNNSDSKVLITTNAASKRFAEIREEVPLCRDVLLTDGAFGPSPFRDALAGNRGRFESPDIGENDPAVMIYTAGLTGRPLGAVLTHGNMSTQFTLLRDICEGREGDVGLCLIPLFHAFGAAANMVSAVELGASVVMMDQLNMDGIFEAIAREKISYIAAVPRLYLGMLLHENAGRYDVGSLRLCITGGSPMIPEFIPPFQEKFSVKLMEGYGLTEASPVSSFSRPWMTQKLGSIGIPIPGAEARIANDAGRDVPANGEGELLIRGKNVMAGYYKDVNATESVIRDGWLYTGDLAKIDEDGYIFLTGRKKRMIITSGFNVYPREVEVVLDMHPLVETSRVLSKPDMMRGEIVKARVVPKKGKTIDEKDLFRHCRTYLSPYKVPREIEIAEHLES